LKNTQRRRDFKGGVAFGVARNFCSGLALTLIICCYWSRGNVLGTRKAEGKRLGEHVQEGECPAPAEVFHPELQY